MNSKILNIMVDLETVGTSPGSGILSIGAVPFYDNETSIGTTAIIKDFEFYARVSEQSLRDHGFNFDIATLQWWNKQDQRVREEAFGGTIHIAEVLDRFTKWLATITSQLATKHEICIWGNGANFDNVLLANAYKRMNKNQAIVRIARKLLNRISFVLKNEISYSS